MTRKKYRIVGSPLGRGAVGDEVDLNDVEARALLALGRVVEVGSTRQAAMTAEAAPASSKPAKKAAKKKRAYKRRDMTAED